MYAQCRPYACPVINDVTITHIIDSFTTHDATCRRRCLEHGTDYKSFSVILTYISQQVAILYLLLLVSNSIVAYNYIDAYKGLSLMICITTLFDLI